jgi:acetyltransferase-like isoleucine patch superfamily enzyme
MAHSYGKYSYGMPAILSWDEEIKLNIGSFCSIGSCGKVYLGGNHRTDRISSFPFGHMHKDIFNNFDGSGHPKTNGDVNIGNDVWLGEHVTIMSGITIGDGAVIAANSHVIKNVAPYSIVGGNPAKLIKYRFTQEQIQKLLEIKWWHWNDEKINEYLPLLCSSNIDDFINAVYKS